MVDYITGHTKSYDLDVNSPENIPDNWYFDEMKMSFSSIAAEYGDVFLLVLNANPDKLFSTYWGSLRNDNGLAIATFEDEFVVFGGYVSNPENVSLESASTVYSNIPLGGFTTSYVQGTVFSDAEGFISQLSLPPLLDCNPVSVSEAHNNESVFIHIYPNPATESLFIEYSLEELATPANIQIMDACGHIIKQIETFALAHSVDISNLTPGIYFIAITLKDNSRIFSRFVKAGH